MTVAGHADGLEGGYIVGWAVDGDDICDIMVLSEFGNVMASGRAGRDRSDLAVLGLGRTDIAFRIAVPDLSACARLHVLANGTEISNSPVETGPGLFNGFFTISGDMATGWVTERVPRFTAPEVTIFAPNGKVVAKGRSKVALSPDDPLFEPARFSLQLDQSCFGRGDILLRASAGGKVFAEATCNLRLLGFAEQVTPSHCSGWLFCPEAPNRRLNVEILVDGHSVGIASCRAPRADVEALYAVSSPGFSKTINPANGGLLELKAISFRLAGSHVELFDGPYIVGSRASVVLATRQLSRLALDVEQKLTGGERTLFQAAIADFLVKSRGADTFTAKLPVSVPATTTATSRLSIIVPVYRGVDFTKRCIESLLRYRNSDLDEIIVINDCSPEPGMAEMLERFRRCDNLQLLTNASNDGFIVTVNRGLAVCPAGDVLLLNSDAQVFAGGLDELFCIGQSSPDIGTVTALSNNATIFSYPHYQLRVDQLEDISWQDLAAIALRDNHGLAIDVPTGHGFCMLIRRPVLDLIGGLDESFGLGYGEENDFCARAADAGFRNVVAPGALVEHKESVSFQTRKDALLAENMRRLETIFPEYTSIITEVARRDDLRRGRWALDKARLRMAGDAGMKFALVVQHSLGGGTYNAIADIEEIVGYNGAARLTLTCRADGIMELSAAAPAFRSVFAQEEVPELFGMLSAAAISVVLVHQILGYTAGFARELVAWVRDQDHYGLFYAHDFYPLCPRVTMIDVTGQFCNAAPTDVCARCISLGGSHSTSELEMLSPREHRALFTELLDAFRCVVTPSESSAGYFRQLFPKARIRSIPHPELPASTEPQRPAGGFEEIVLLGALGPHKGSAMLLEIAQRALLTHSWLRFHVIGFTNIDDELTALGNVTITGGYKRAELDRLCTETTGRIALFLSPWPETYSYTLSEAARQGFIPLVPDIGALAERVRFSGFGIVFPFPIVAEQVLNIISGVQDGTVAVAKPGSGPSDLIANERSEADTRQVMTRDRAALAPPLPV